MINFVRSNIFDIQAVNAYVNPVNCVGVMGAGLAAQFKQRYREMFDDYKLACTRGAIQPGTIHIWYNSEISIINFPTKVHWKDKSNHEYIDDGLLALAGYLATCDPELTVAIPAIGCGLGGLKWDIVRGQIEEHLSLLPNNIIVCIPEGYGLPDYKSMNESGGEHYI